MSLALSDSQRVQFVERFDSTFGNTDLILFLSNRRFMLYCSVIEDHIVSCSDAVLIDLNSIHLSIRLSRKKLEEFIQDKLD